jgi:hypothetical protein
LAGEAVTGEALSSNCHSESWHAWTRGDNQKEFSGRARAFSSEVDTGSRWENASKQQSRGFFRFHRKGNGSLE